MRWQIEIIPWTLIGGMILGFLAEVIWRGNFLWMAAGAIIGALAGTVCDTVLYFYRRLKRQRAEKEF